MNKCVLIACVSACALVVGCTSSLKTSKVGSEELQTGMTYALPRMAFTVQTKAVITKCTYTNGKASISYQLDQGDFIGNLENDPDEIYSVDVDSLHAAVKDTGVTVTRFTKDGIPGMLSSVTTKVTGREGDVIASGITTVLNIAKITTLAGMPTSTTKQVTTGECPGPLGEAFEMRRKLLKSLPAAVASDKALSGALTGLAKATAKHTQAMAALADAKKTNSTDVPSLQAKVNEAKLALDTEQARLDRIKPHSLQVPDIEAQLSEISDSLTVPLILRDWSPSYTDMKQKVLRSVKGEDKSALCNLAPAVKQRDWINAWYEREKADPIAMADIEEEFQFLACVIPPGKVQDVKSARSEKDVLPLDGIVYREPFWGHAFIKIPDSQVEHYATQKALLPQFGQKFLSRHASSAFGSGSSEDKFSEIGAIISTSRERKAEAAAFAATSASATGQISKHIESSRKDELTLQNSVLNLQIEQAKLRQQLDELKK